MSTESGSKKRTNIEFWKEYLQQSVKYKLGRFFEQFTDIRSELRTVGSRENEVVFQCVVRGFSPSTGRIVVEEAGRVPRTVVDRATDRMGRKLRLGVARRTAIGARA